VLGREETTGPRQYLDAIYDAQLAIESTIDHDAMQMEFTRRNATENVILYSTS
jgi:hypothetical protein